MAPHGDRTLGATGLFTENQHGSVWTPSQTHVPPPPEQFSPTQIEQFA